MSPTRFRRSGRPLRPRVARPAALLLLAGTLVAAPLASGASAAPPAGSSLAAVGAPTTVTYDRGLPRDRQVPAQLLSFNDFHGAIDKPTGSGGLVNGVPAGGVEYLATTVRRLRAEAGRTRTFTVGAGDLVGASPLVSAAFHDEPAVETLSELGLQISAVGNHEFDEGVDELKRLQYGGCHPVDGCQDGDGFAGAEYRYLAANVVDKTTRRPIFPAYAVRMVRGVKVGFVGMTLKGTPSIVNPAGIQSVEFLDEASTANYYARYLRARYGVRALVLLLHEGGTQNVAPPAVADPSGCAGFSGDVVPIVAKLRSEFGAVVSGHTHQWYVCQLPNAAGRPTLVTSAGSNGRLVTDIDATLDRRSGTFAALTARNVIAENSDPAAADPAVKAIADEYRAAVAPIANRVVGSITADILRAPNAAGESALGDVIADAQLAYTTSAGAQIALMNPGGIRADLDFEFSPGGEAPGQVTYGEAFTVQPFNNLVVTQTLTGQQIEDVLEQQFVVATPPRILQVSAGFTYTYDAAAPAGSRVSATALNSVPIDPAATYRVTTNDFLANGGDGFTTLTAGTDRATTPGFDVDALTAYLGGPNAPVPPGPQNRITAV